jgi:hypothetical protein
MPAPSAISRIALKAATMNDDISARKKFIAPVTVPICARLEKAQKLRHQVAQCSYSRLANRISTPFSSI